MFDRLHASPTERRGVAVAGLGFKVEGIGDDTSDADERGGLEVGDGLLLLGDDAGLVGALGLGGFEVGDGDDGRPCAQGCGGRLAALEAHHAVSGGEEGGGRGPVLGVLGDEEGEGAVGEAAGDGDLHGAGLGGDLAQAVRGHVLPVEAPDEPRGLLRNARAVGPLLGEGLWADAPAGDGEVQVSVLGVREFGEARDEFVEDEVDGDGSHSFHSSASNTRRQQPPRRHVPIPVP